MTQPVPKALQGQTVPVKGPDGAIWDVPIEQANSGWGTPATSADLEADARRQAETKATALREERGATGLGMYEKAVDVATLAGIGLTGPGALLGLQTSVGRSALGNVFSGDTESAAYSQGTSDGITMGLGKLARKEAIRALYGEGAAEKLVTEQKLTQALDPGAYMRGSIQGGIEGSIAANVASKLGGLAKLASGPQAIPELAGALTEAGLAKAGLTAGETLASHALKGAVQLGVRGGVEGAIAGGATELTEEMFGDPSVSGEKVFLAAGKGALAGLLTGGVLGAAVPVAGQLGRKAVSVADEIPEAINSRLRGLSEASDEQAFRHLSVHARKKLVDTAEERIVGGHKELGAFAKRSGILDTSGPGQAVTNNTPERMLERANAVLEDAGGQLGKLYRESVATVGTGDLHKIVSKILNEADETGLALAQQAGRGKNVRAIDDYVTDFLLKSGMIDNEGKLVADKAISVGEAYAQKRALSKSIYQDYSALEAKGPMATLRKFEREFDDLLTAKMAEAGEDVATLRRAKGDYQRGVLVRDIIEDGIVKEAKNRAVSPSDYGTGLAFGMLTGDPITGLAASAIHNQVRRRGNAVAAYALDRIASLGGVQKMVKETDDALELAARAASGEKRLPYRSAANDNGGGSLRKRYEMAVSHVTAMTPEAVQAAAGRLARIGNAPKITEAFAAAIARTAAALTAQMPKRDAAGPLHKPRPTETQMREFLTAYETAMDPTSAVKKIQAGSMDPAITRQLEASAPQVYADLRAQVANRFLGRIEKGYAPPQSELMKLHLAFGITVDPTLSPQSLLSQQQAIEGEMDQQQAPRRSRPMNLKAFTDVNGPDRLER